MSLKRFREPLGKTQDDVAREIGVSKEYYSQIERGVVKLPGPELRRRIAEALQIRHVDVLVELGVLDDWEVPGTNPLDQGDPELERRIALLKDVNLNRDHRGSTLDMILEGWAKQDREALRARPGASRA